MRSPNVLILARENHDRAEIEQLQSLLLPHVAVTCIRDGMEMDRFLERGAYDALFYLRPDGLAGWKEPLRKIRSRHPDLPVILLSKNEMLGEFSEALRAGAFDFLVPPYASHNLLAAVAHAVASTEARGWQTVQR